MSFTNDTGKFHALHNISFAIPKGKVVALVGESGSGKSVTSMAIMQLLAMPPAAIDSGSIIFNDQSQPVNLLSLSKKEMQKIRGKKIAMVFQEPMSALNPLIRVGQQVLEMIVTHNHTITKKEAQLRCVDLFEKVQLPNPATIGKKYPHELSGGQKQRIVIAMALCCNPQLLICDEPTTALDVTVQQEILLLLQSLQKEYQLSILFISHDLHVVANIADEMVVLYKGAIVEQGATYNVLNAPKHVYTKALLQCRPGSQPPKTMLPTVADFLSEQPLQIEAFDAIQPQDETLLSVKNMVVQYHAKKTWFGKKQDTFIAVNNVSFQIKKGEIVGLVGESGCGKTTIGRSIIGLQKMNSGSIEWAGPTHGTNKSRQWQMVFQDPYASLNPKVNIGHAISEGVFVNHIANKKTSMTIAADWLQKIGLQKEHITKYPHEFSGGQRQRIVIARALALSPQFVVCDESVSALDVSVQSQILNILLRLKNELGFSILFISHDMSVIQHICDRVLVMRKGIIVEEGNADELFKKPKHAYTAQLIKASTVNHRDF